MLKTDPLRKDLLVAPSAEQIPVNVEDFITEARRVAREVRALVPLGAKGPRARLAARRARGREDLRRRGRVWLAANNA